ncbi:peptide deformylase [Caldicellulosiruptoraceae bacterium PP1]
MAIRKIRHIGDDVLRKKARTVEKFDGRLKQLIQDMLETMYEANGVGLAAPQVGILKRVIVIDAGDGPIAVINPTITSYEGSSIDIEGCLSVPEQWGEVERPEKVVVKGFDENGNEIQIEAEGLLARAFCHEIDHLEGVLFVDKVIRFVTKEELEEKREEGHKMDLE